MVFVNLFIYFFFFLLFCFGMSQRIPIWVLVTRLTWARSIQPKLRPVRPGKEDHLKRWTSFFETFPVGPKGAIEFWTEISGNFGGMDRAHCYHPDLDNDTSSVWNFCARSSDVISRGNQWWSREYRLSSQPNFLMEDVLSFGNQ